MPDFPYYRECCYLNKDYIEIKVYLVFNSLYTDIVFPKTYLYTLVDHKAIVFKQTDVLNHSRRPCNGYIKRQSLHLMSHFGTHSFPVKDQIIKSQRNK